LLVKKKVYLPTYTNLEIDADDYEVEFDLAEMVELDNMSRRTQRLEK
jgi:hypothetical protein